VIAGRCQSEPYLSPPAHTGRQGGGTTGGGARSTAIPPCDGAGPQGLWTAPASAGVYARRHEVDWFAEAASLVQMPKRRRCGECLLGLLSKRRCVHHGTSAHRHQTQAHADDRCGSRTRGTTRSGGTNHRHLSCGKNGGVAGEASGPGKRLSNGRSRDALWALPGL